jgi:hypothetical protein
MNRLAAEYSPGAERTSLSDPISTLALKGCIPFTGPLNLSPLSAADTAELTLAARRCRPLPSRPSTQCRAPNVPRPYLDQLTCLGR